MRSTRHPLWWAHVSAQVSGEFNEVHEIMFMVKSKHTFYKYLNVRNFQLVVWPVFIPTSLVFLLMCLCGLSWLWLMYPPDVVVVSGGVIPLCFGAYCTLIHFRHEPHMTRPMMFKSFLAPATLAALTLWPGYTYTLYQAYKRMSKAPGGELEPLPEAWLWRGFAIDADAGVGLVLLGCGAVLLWTVVLCVNVYIPGPLTKDRPYSEGDFRWMVSNMRFSRSQRQEVGRHLAARSPDSVMCALTLELEDDQRIVIATHHMLDTFELSEIERVCYDSIPRMSDEALDVLMKTWQGRDDRARVLSLWLGAPVLSRHHVWAPVLLEEALAHRPQLLAQEAAMTTLFTSHVTLHTRAIAHLMAHATPLHVRRLVEVKDAFSINPTIDSKIQEVLDHLALTHGVSPGQLTLSEDDARSGALSTTDE